MSRLFRFTTISRFVRLRTVDRLYGLRLIVFMGFVFCLFTAKAQDTLYFWNNTRLVGKFRNIDVGTVKFKITDIAEVTFQLDKVKTMHITSKALRVETIFRKSFVGYVIPSPTDGAIRILTTTDTTDIFMSTVLKASAFGNAFWSSLSGYVSSGYSYTRSSDVGRFNLDGRVLYTNKKIETGLQGSTIMTQEEGTFTRDKEDLTLQCSYFYNPSWYTQLLLNYQRNLELGLTRRYQEGGGIGNRILATKSMQAKLLTGYLINQEVGTGEGRSGILSEIPIILTYNFYHFAKPKINISTYQAIFFGVNQNGRIRQDGKLTVIWKFFSDFSYNVSFYHNYDSQPPSSSSAALDYGIVFSLAYNFN
jgi:hypothetical protein